MKQFLRKWFWHPPYPFRIPFLLAKKYLKPDPYKGWRKRNYPSLISRFFEYENVSLDKTGTTFSLITLVFDPKLSHLKKCAQSVLKQSYSNFEWVVVDNGSTKPAILEYLDKLGSLDTRIRVFKAPSPLGIAKGTQLAVKKTKGAWLAFLDHDDTLDPCAIEDFAKVVSRRPNVGFLYSDSDHCDEVDRRFYPLLKPDLSPEYILGANYICHFHAIKKDLYQSLVSHESELEGSQDWDLTIRAVHSGTEIYHVPKILYSQRVHPKQYSSHVFRDTDSKIKQALQASQIRCLENYLQKRQLKDYAPRPLSEPGQYYLRYTGKPLGEMAILEHGRHPFWESVKNLKTPYFAYLNEGVTIQNEDWKEQALGLFEREPNVALQGGKIISKHGTLIPTILILDEYASYLNPSSYALARPDLEVRREVAGLKSDWWIGRTKVFQKIAPRVEDTNLSLEIYCACELASLQYRVVYDPLLYATSQNRDKSIEEVYAERVNPSYYSKLLNPRSGYHYEFKNL